MIKLIPAAQLYTLRDYCTTLIDIESTFDRVKNMGYNSIQMSGMNFSEPKEIAKLVEKYGFDVCITHMPFDRMINDTKNLVEEHKAYGCDTIGIGGLPDKYQSYEGYIEFSKIMNETSKKLREYGMNFSYHNHAFELAHYNNTTGLDILIDNSDDNVLFTLDLYWLQAGGAFPQEYLQKLKNRVKVAHFKDMSAKGNTPILTPVGEGNMNYLLLTKVANDTGVQYVAVEQDECYDACPFTCLETSLKNINKYIDILNKE